MFEVTFHEGDVGCALHLRYDFVDGQAVEENRQFTTREAARDYAISSAHSLLLAVVEVYVKHKKKLSRYSEYGFARYQDSVELCLRYLQWTFPHPYSRCYLEVARVTERMIPFFEQVMPYQHYPSYQASVKHLELIKTLSKYLITELQ